MSLILDALRKSEHQRQRQVGPGLAVVPEASERRRPATWLLVLGALLALNVLVLAALLLTDRASDPAPTERRATTDRTDRPASTVAAPDPVQPRPATGAPKATPREALRQAPVELPARPPRSEVRPLTTEVGAGPAAAVQRPTLQMPAATAQRPMLQTPTGVDPAPAAATATTPVMQQATDDARLPRFTDLVVRGELNVPHMHVDIHVFSPAPAERFVFINMRKYGEGESTQEGPRVERITTDGVVMDYQGQRFFLPRD